MYATVVAVMLSFIFAICCQLSKDTGRGWWVSFPMGL